MIKFLVSVYMLPALAVKIVGETIVAVLNVIIALYILPVSIVTMYLKIRATRKLIKQMEAELEVKRQALLKALRGE